PGGPGGGTPPAHYQPGMHHPDPYAGDQPLFRITAEDVERNRNLLAVGLVDLLERNPDYYVRVFPTRRSASAPQRIYDATRENAEKAQLIEHGDAISGAAAGIPGPSPPNAMDGIWGHIL